MIKYKQLYKHAPEDGQYGDCHRTALAAILNVPQESVPNFGEHYDCHENFVAAETEWLHSQGLASFTAPYSAKTTTLSQLLWSLKHHAPNIPVVVIVATERGLAHSIIACNGKIVLDPYTGEEEPNIEKYAGVDDEVTGDTYFWVQILVPASIKYYG